MGLRAGDVPGSACSASPPGRSHGRRRMSRLPAWTMSPPTAACRRTPGRRMPGTVGLSRSTGRSCASTWAAATPRAPLARRWSLGSLRSACPPRGAPPISQRPWDRGVGPCASSPRPPSGGIAADGPRSIARTGAWAPRDGLGCPRRRPGHWRPAEGRRSLRSLTLTPLPLPSHGRARGACKGRARR